jgi:hypothetical protein
MKNNVHIMHMHVLINWDGWMENTTVVGGMCENMVFVFDWNSKVFKQHDSNISRR